MAALAAVAFAGGAVLAGFGGAALAQETICSRAHTKIFIRETGKVECVEINKSLQRDNQQVLKQRQRIIQQRARQEQVSRQLTIRSNQQGAAARQRQISQQQELVSRQRAAAQRQKRLVNQQRALQSSQRRQLLGISN